MKKFGQYLAESSKMAHKYILNVKWSHREDWNITILAMDVNSVAVWLHSATEKDSDYITSVSINLVERNSSKVKDNFVAKGID